MGLGERRGVRQRALIAAGQSRACMGRAHPLRSRPASERRDGIMHLYGSLASPFVQRVLMTARAKGHDIDVRFPPGEGGMKSEEFRAISPMGRIPILALDDGQHLCESDAICGYLDETLDGPALLPGTALDRARVREMTALATLEIAAGFRPLMVHKVFRIGDSPDVVAAAVRQAECGLDALARLIDAAGPFATGTKVTAADCALVPILTLSQIIEPMAGTWSVVAQRPAIARYYERVLAEPLAGRVSSEMREGFAAIFGRNAAAG
jgi:glutathione S-transferase